MLWSYANLIGFNRRQLKAGVNVDELPSKTPCCLYVGSFLLRYLAVFAQFASRRKLAWTWEIHKNTKKNTNKVAQKMMHNTQKCAHSLCVHIMRYYVARYTAYSRSDNFPSYLPHNDRSCDVVPAVGSEGTGDDDRDNAAWRWRSSTSAVYGCFAHSTIRCAVNFLIIHVHSHKNSGKTVLSHHRLNQTFFPYFFRKCAGLTLVIY